DAVHADDTAGARRVLNDQLLTEDFTHTGCKDSADDVECASRGKRHDHGDRARRISLRLCRERPARRHAEHCDELAPSDHLITPSAWASNLGRISIELHPVTFRLAGLKDNRFRDGHQRVLWSFCNWRA